MVKNLVLSYEEFAKADELNASEQALFAKAKAAAKNAYAPYSKFLVGCALELENGHIITGNNQENAAYPLGLCAERVAFFNAGANFKDIKIKTAAIYAESELFIVDRPVSPCGACRQAMSEYEQNQQLPIAVVMGGQAGPIARIKAITDLLPLLFSKTSLNL
ncbi:MAG TPA: cytidine deaminase [Flavobacteriales bacterium]|nr:cytidine deaminase [Flavobacteriales bacterium]